VDSHRLNRRITIKRRASGQDAAGQPLGTWQFNRGSDVDAVVYLAPHVQ
jgi:head-tail adaptor